MSQVSTQHKRQKSTSSYNNVYYIPDIFYSSIDNEQKVDRKRVFVFKTKQDFEDEPVRIPLDKRCELIPFPTEEGKQPSEQEFGDTYHLGISPTREEVSLYASTYLKRVSLKTANLPF